MKRVFKATRLAALTLAIAAGSAELASAQPGGTDGAGSTGSVTTGRTTGSGTTQDTRSDRGFDYGWLGLIGLAGLIPLFLRRNGNGHANHYDAGNRGAAR